MATRKSSRGSRQVGRNFEGVRLSAGSRVRGARPGLSKELFEDKSNLEWQKTPLGLVRDPRG